MRISVDRSKCTGRRHMRLEHWSSAAEQGATAGAAAALPGTAKPYQIVPSAAS